MPRLKPIAVFITLLFMLAAAIAAGLAALPSNVAGAEGGNVPIVTNLNISPALNITRFEPYTLSVNVNPNGSTVNNVSFVIRPQTASVSNSNWDFFTNGSPNPDPNFPFTREATQQGATETWSYNSLRPDNIYPEIAFIRGISSAPSNSRFWRDSYQLMHFTNHFNMSANTSFFIEIYATPKTSPPLSVDMQVFLVGNGFDISDFQGGGVFANEAWRNHTDVELAGTIGQASAFHHTHSINSSHFLIPLSTNSSGKIEIGSKSIDISGDFWLILTTGHQLQNRGWDLKYHAGCNNNGTWYKGSGTNFVLQSGCPDAHVHFARELPPEPYNRMEVNVSVGYTEGGNGYVFNSSMQPFYFSELPNLPPNPSAFTAPAPGIYQGDVTISWLPASDANNDPLTYNVSLIGDEGTTTIASGLIATSFSLNTSAYPDGFYNISVEACESGTDDLFCTDFDLLSNFDEGLCEFFRIWNGDPEDGVIGTTGNPYLICNVCDLQNMKLNLSAHYALNNSIDLTGFDWGNWSDGNGFMPVGNGSGAFTGTFNGSGYTITGLFINRSVNNVGLFGYVETGGAVSNVSLASVNISGDSFVGGLVGTSYGSVFNCSASGNVNGSQSVGGLVGYNNAGTVSNSSVAVNVSGTSSHTGGLVGFNDASSGDGSISNSYATGNVNGVDNVGGLVGENQGPISNSYAMGNTNGSDCVGGLVGENGIALSTIDNSYSTGYVSGGSNIGGLVGCNTSGSVNSSFYDSDTSGQSDNDGRGVPKNTSEMNTLSTFANAGWDIEGNATNINDGYPFLSWQIQGNSPVWYIYQCSVTLNASSTAGGSVTDPGEAGPYPYNCSQVVTITAANESCYHFVNWTGTGVNAGAVDNASAASTTITMNASYTIQANFAAGAFCGGTGTAGDPYLICDVCNLQAMNLNLSAHYALNNDINASATSAWNGGDGFRPVGIETDAFIGGFDGRGYNISGLFIQRWGMDNVGLFGYVNSSGSIANVSLIDADVSGADAVGTLVGNNEGTVTNCSAAGEVNGTQTLGGLVGRSMGWYGGLISDCHAAVDVSGSACNIGGLVGWSDGPVSNSSATGNASGQCDIGGLVGGNANANVINCSYATGTVSGTGDSIGGLLGYNENGTVANSYASGNVNGASYVGGLVGRNNNYINNSYSTGYVSGNGSDIGGLVGLNNSGPVDNSFWDMQTSNMSTSNGGTGKTTAEMKTLSTFNGSGWDIEENTVNINNGYPYLSWQTPGNSPIWYIYPGPFSFTLNYSSGAGGSVTGNSSQIVAYGGNGTAVQAVPDTCYHFVSWNDSVTDNPRTDINVTDNISVTANFAAGYAYASGSGTTGDPWLITNVSELQAMICDLGAHYALNNSIEASATSGWNGGAGFMPVGNGSGTFTGTFDGRGYTITGLFINRSATDYVGLFGYINTGGAVSNVSLVNVSITGYDRVGGLVGYNYNGSISGTSAAGTVNGHDGVGGLVGRNNYGVVSNCQTAVTVIGGSYVGGLIGELPNGGSVSNCSASGDVSSTAPYSAAGGLIGYIYYNCPVSGSWATGNVSGQAYVGGLIGVSEESAVSNCYATGHVNASNTGIGGLIGGNFDGTLSNCYATGNASGSAYVGGLIGSNKNSPVSGSWATGNVSVSNSCAGGLIGHNYDGSTLSSTSAAGMVSGVDTLGGLVGSNEDSQVSDSSATGTVTGLNAAVGGLMGQNYGGTVYNCSAAGDVSTGNITGNSMAGGLAGSNGGAVANCSANGSVSASGDYVGGLIGQNITGGSVSNSSAAGAVNGRYYVGGLAGENQVNGSIYDSHATGNTSGSEIVGGLVGLNNASTSDSYATGKVTGNQHVGGFAGYNDYGTVNSSYSTGGVIGNWDVGGFVGFNNWGTVNNSYSTGNVNAANNRAGGFVGTNFASVSDSYARGNVNGIQYIGGFAGQNNGGSAVITMSYSTGTVSGTSDLGGLVGLNSFGTVNSSFWDMQTSGRATSSGGTGLNTSEMKSFFTFYDAGWDLICESDNGTDDIWGIDQTGADNDGYPFLWWQEMTHNVSFTLTYTAGPNGTINGTSPQVVGCNGSGSAVQAVPDNCYVFVNWSDSITANPRTDTNVFGNITVTANFAMDTFMLNTSSTIGGNVSPPGEGSFGPYNCSEIVPITAVNDSCYYFVNWSGTGVDAGMVAAPGNASTTINMSHSYSVQANFAIYQYTLNYSAGAHGSIAANASQIVNCGSSGLPVTAAADACYHFVNWSDAETDNPRTDNNVLGNIAATANFAIDQVTLTTSSSAGGNVTAPGEAGPYGYDCGNIVTINATPDACYHFVNWTGTGVDGGMVDDPNAVSTTINMSGSYAVQANFAIDTFTLTYNAGAGGSITGTTPQTVNCGADGAQVTAVPDACYHFVNWSDGLATSARIDPNVLGDITVTANFAIDTFTLTYTAGTGGTINGTTPQVVNCGTDGTGVTAVPNAGFNFLSWSDGLTTAARTDTNVLGDITVTANFRRPGGGGGYSPPSVLELNIDIFDHTIMALTDNSGQVQGDVYAISPDGNVSIHIPAGTTALFGNGSPLTELNVDPVESCPGPPDGMTVIAAFDFHPDGATFDPAIQITVTYDPDALPEGADASQLVIAFYNEATGTWQYLSGTVNPDTNTIIFSVTHFTLFAVMTPGECAPAPSGTPGPTLEPTATPTVEPAVEPTQTPTVAPTPTPTATAMPPAGGGDDDSDNRELLVGIIAGCAILGALVAAIAIRMRKK